MSAPAGGGSGAAGPPKVMMTIPSQKTHSSDMVHLPNWVANTNSDHEEIVAAVRHVSGGGLSEILATKAQHYSVIHHELARQAAVHCPTTARLLVQVWRSMCFLTAAALDVGEKYQQDASVFKSKLKEVVQTVTPQLNSLSQQRDNLRSELQDSHDNYAALMARFSAMQKTLMIAQDELTRTKDRLAALMAALGGSLDGGAGAAAAVGGGGGSLSSALIALSDDMSASAKQMALLGVLERVEEERRRQEMLMDQLVGLMRMYRTFLFRGSMTLEGGNSRHAEIQTELSFHPLAHFSLTIHPGDLDLYGPDEKIPGVEKNGPSFPPRTARPALCVPLEWRYLLSDVPFVQTGRAGDADMIIRPLPLPLLRRALLQLAMDKAFFDNQTLSATRLRVSFPSYMSEMWKNKYGIPELVDKRMLEVFASMRAHFFADPRVRFFDLFIGTVLTRPDGRPVFGPQATDFMVALIDDLRRHSIVVRDAVVSSATPISSVKFGPTGTAYVYKDPAVGSSRRGSIIEEENEDDDDKKSSASGINDGDDTKRSGRTLGEELDSAIRSDDQDGNGLESSMFAGAHTKRPGTSGREAGADGDGDQPQEEEMKPPSAVIKIIAIERSKAISVLRSRLSFAPDYVLNRLSAEVLLLPPVLRRNGRPANENVAVVNGSGLRVAATLYWPLSISTGPSAMGELNPSSRGDKSSRSGDGYGGDSKRGDAGKQASSINVFDSLIDLDAFLRFALLAFVELQLLWQERMAQAFEAYSTDATAYFFPSHARFGFTQEDSTAELVPADMPVGSVPGAAKRPSSGAPKEEKEKEKEKSSKSKDKDGKVPRGSSTSVDSSEGGNSGMAGFATVGNSLELAITTAVGEDNDDEKQLLANPENFVPYGQTHQQVISARAAAIANGLIVPRSVRFAGVEGGSRPGSASGASTPAASSRRKGAPGAPTLLSSNPGSIHGAVATGIGTNRPTPRMHALALQPSKRSILSLAKQPSVQNLLLSAPSNYTGMSGVNSGRSARDNEMVIKRKPDGGRDAGDDEDGLGSMPSLRRQNTLTSGSSVSLIRQATAGKANKGALIAAQSTMGLKSNKFKSMNSLSGPGKGIGLGMGISQKTVTTGPQAPTVNEQIEASALGVAAEIYSWRGVVATLPFVTSLKIPIPGYGFGMVNGKSALPTIPGFTSGNVPAPKTPTASSSSSSGTSAKSGSASPTKSSKADKSPSRASAAPLAASTNSSFAVKNADASPVPSAASLAVVVPPLKKNRFGHVVQPAPPQLMQIRFTAVDADGLPQRRINIAALLRLPPLVRLAAAYVGALLRRSMVLSPMAKLLQAEREKQEREREAREAMNSPDSASPDGKRTNSRGPGAKKPGATGSLSSPSTSASFFGKDSLNSAREKDAKAEKLEKEKAEKDKAEAERLATVSSVALTDENDLVAALSRKPMYPAGIRLGLPAALTALLSGRGIDRYLLDEIPNTVAAKKTEVEAMTEALAAAAEERAKRASSLLSTKSKKGGSLGSKSGLSAASKKLGSVTKKDIAAPTPASGTSGPTPANPVASDAKDSTAEEGVEVDEKALRLQSLLNNSAAAGITGADSAEVPTGPEEEDWQGPYAYIITQAVMNGSGLGGSTIAGAIAASLLALTPGQAAGLEVMYTPSVKPWDTVFNDVESWVEEEMATLNTAGGPTAINNPSQTAVVATARRGRGMERNRDLFMVGEGDDRPSTARSNPPPPPPRPLSSGSASSPRVPKPPSRGDTPTSSRPGTAREAVAALLGAAEDETARSTGRSGGGGGLTSARSVKSLGQIGRSKTTGPGALSARDTAIVKAAAGKNGESLLSREMGMDDRTMHIGNISAMAAAGTRSRRFIRDAYGYSGNHGGNERFQGGYGNSHYLAGGSIFALEDDRDFRQALASRSKRPGAGGSSSGTTAGTVGGLTDRGGLSARMDSGSVGGGFDSFRLAMTGRSNSSGPSIGGMSGDSIGSGTARPLSGRSNGALELGLTPLRASDEVPNYMVSIPSPVPAWDEISWTVMRGLDVALATNQVLAGRGFMGLASAPPAGGLHPAALGVYPEPVYAQEPNDQAGSRLNSAMNRKHLSSAGVGPGGLTGGAVLTGGLNALGPPPVDTHLNFSTYSATYGSATSHYNSVCHGTSPETIKLLRGNPGIAAVATRVLDPVRSAARSRRAISLEGVKEIIARTDPWVPPAAVEKMFEYSRAKLEEAVWQATLAGWHTASHAPTGRILWFNRRTNEVSWDKPPAIPRQRIYDLDWSSFVDMCVRHGLMRFTDSWNDCSSIPKVLRFGQGMADDGSGGSGGAQGFADGKDGGGVNGHLEAFTKAAIRIQRMFRAHRIRRRLEEQRAERIRRMREMAKEEEERIIAMEQEMLKNKQQKAAELSRTVEQEQAEIEALRKVREERQEKELMAYAQALQNERLALQSRLQKEYESGVQAVVAEHEAKMQLMKDETELWLANQSAKMSGGLVSAVNSGIVPLGAGHAQKKGIQMSDSLNKITRAAQMKQQSFSSISQAMASGPNAAMAAATIGGGSVGSTSPSSAGGPPGSPSLMGGGSAAGGSLSPPPTAPNQYTVLTQHSTLLGGALAASNMNLTGGVGLMGSSTSSISGSITNRGQTPSLSEMTAAAAARARASVSPKVGESNFLGGAGNGSPTPSRQMDDGRGSSISGGLSRSASAMAGDLAGDVGSAPAPASASIAGLGPLGEMAEGKEADAEADEAEGKEGSRAASTLGPLDPSQGLHDPLLGPPGSRKPSRPATANVLTAESKDAELVAAADALDKIATPAASRLHSAAGMRPASGMTMAGGGGGAFPVVPPTGKKAERIGLVSAGSRPGSRMGSPQPGSRPASPLKDASGSIEGGGGTAFVRRPATASAAAAASPPAAPDQSSSTPVPTMPAPAPAPFPAAPTATPAPPTERQRSNIIIERERDISAAKFDRAASSASAASDIVTPPKDVKAAVVTLSLDSDAIPPPGGVGRRSSMANIGDQGGDGNAAPAPPPGGRRGSVEYYQQQMMRRASMTKPTVPTFGGSAADLEAISGGLALKGQFLGGSSGVDGQTPLPAAGGTAVPSGGPAPVNRRGSLTIGLPAGGMGDMGGGITGTRMTSGPTTNSAIPMARESSRPQESIAVPLPHAVAATVAAALSSLGEDAFLAALQKLLVSGAGAALGSPTGRDNLGEMMHQQGAVRGRNVRRASMTGPVPVPSFSPAPAQPSRATSEAAAAPPQSLPAPHIAAPAESHLHSAPPFLMSPVPSNGTPMP